MIYMYLVASFLLIYVYIIDITYKEKELKAIISLIKGYKENSILPFLVTLRNTSPTTTLIAFTDSSTLPIIQKYIQPFFLKAIILSDNYPYYPINDKNYYIESDVLNKYIPKYIKKESYYFWFTIRYQLYNIWLKYYGNIYAWYFITDVKDVLFQSDIFSISLPKGVHLLSEIYKRGDKFGIEACPVNVIWIKPLNPPSHIMKKPIINGGTILGSSDELRKFIYEFSQYMNDIKRNTMDQAILNYFYYTRKFKYPVYVHQHKKGYCLSAHSDFYLSCDAFTPINGTLYDDEKKIVACIHGWNRAFEVDCYKRKVEYRILLKERVGYITM